MSKLTTILLANPRGFCAGVDRAVDIVDIALRTYGAPVYMRHEIVHNPVVVKELEAKGAVFVERTDQIPEGSVAVFSAHGVSPLVRAEAVSRKLKTIDATCPLVTKVHLEAIRYSREGYSIILIGHRGHVEMEGTSGEAPNNTTLIETIADAETVTVPNPERVVYLTQTTLSIDDTAEIIATLKRRFPNIVAPPKQDICYATTNRQAAVKVLAEQADVVLVLGATQSSNSVRLMEVAKKQGTPAYLILSANDIEPAWFENAETVGVTSGASSPEHLVEQVVDRLKALGATDVRDVDVIKESVRFILPPAFKAEAQAAGKADDILAKHEIHADMTMKVS